MFDIRSFLAVAIPPQPIDVDWLENATSGIDYLRANYTSEDIILYANAGQLWVFAFLAKVPDEASPHLQKIQNCHANADSGWSINHVWGGGEPERVYVSDPTEGYHCDVLEAAEQLVFRRYFTGVDKGPVRTELSQKLIQALGLYWHEEESAYCKLDEDGDIEPVVRVIDLSAYTGERSDTVVTISAHELHRYMTATGTSLVTKFDFTRYSPGAFPGWHNPTRDHLTEHDLHFHSGVQPQCSFANGVLLLRSLLTEEMLIRRSRAEWTDEDKEYATFKAHDWKNDRVAEVSCSPQALASYFEKESPLPFQTTPAFFRPEVLQKYKADPDKYTLEHRSIECRGAWYLKSYDVNEAGQVHAYLCDLARLPYKEQLYWQSFNEWPKGPISKRAVETDFLGKFSTIDDPVLDIKYHVEKLDQAKPDWWLPRGKRVAANLHYPITASTEEWANAVLALDQLVVEGFSTKALRTRLKAAGHVLDKQWGSLKLLQECLLVGGVDEDELTDLMEPLRCVHHLRSKVKGHSSERERQKLITDARKKHGGSLPAHFRQLAWDVQRSFDRIVELL